MVVKNKFYEWWKSNRRTDTFGSFLILFVLYVYPVIKESRYKNSCIKLSEKAALNKFNYDNIQENLLKETGLSIKDLAKIEAYKNCAT